MSFTIVTVTGKFSAPDNSPAVGTVMATPNAPMRNGTAEVTDSPVVGVLNAAGELRAQSGGPFTLNANDDAATTPVGASYSFVIELDGAPMRCFYAVVSHTTPTVDISALEPA